MTLRKFNKNKATKRLDNKNNKNTKITTIVISLIVLIGAIIFFSFARFESNSEFNLIDGTVAKKEILFIDYIKNLNYEYLVSDGVDELGEYGTSDNNLRYIGADPNNYVYINCTTTDPDKMSSRTCYRGRMYGVFNNIEDENGNVDSFIKVRTWDIGNYSWDSSPSSINGGTGINQWGESGNYQGSDLMRELNNYFLYDDGTTYEWVNYQYEQSENNDYPDENMWEDPDSYIQAVKWNTGYITPNNVRSYNANLFYNEERLNNVTRNCTTGSACNDTVVRTTEWVGKMALMYASDYYYSTSGGSTVSRGNCVQKSVNDWANEAECYNNTWLKVEADEEHDDYRCDWLLSPVNSANLSNAVLALCPENDVGTSYAYYDYGIAGAFYLKNNLSYAGGDGTKANPYKFVVNE